MKFLPGSVYARPVPSTQHPCLYPDSVAGISCTTKCSGQFPDDPRFRVYKIHQGDTRASNPDYAGWLFDDGAPAVKDHAGQDSLDGEGYRIPLLHGDEAVWTVFNDANFAEHNSGPGSGSPGPLGVEAQLYAYAYDSTGDLGRIIFMQYTLINKSGNTLDSMHVAFWADPDASDPFGALVSNSCLLIRLTAQSQN